MSSKHSRDPQGLLDKFEVAKVLLERCQRELLRRGPGAAELGVTIFVHARELGPHDTQKAVVSMLNDRSELRAILADYLVEATLADGVPVDKLHEVASADHRRIYGEPEDDQ